MTDDELIIESCDDCGACCMEQGSPPGYLYLLRRGGDVPDWPDDDDLQRVASLPADARRVLDEYGRALLAGEVDGDGPCVWLDQETRRCRWHEHRPQICRDFDRGSDGCRDWRKLYQITGA